MHSCTKVSNTGTCPHCNSKQIIKNGTTKNKKQQFYCKYCKKRFIDYYSNKAYKKEINKNIITLTKEGVGIRGIARVLKISPTTVIKRILLIAQNIKPPVLHFYKTYELDELNTFVRYKSKRIWIVCALQRDTRKVVRFTVGTRTNRTLSKITSTLQLAKAKKIYTDKLVNYKNLITHKIHTTQKYGTNYVERTFLTLRTHLKRLNRRTIGFSKSKIVLKAILVIYFWA